MAGGSANVETNAALVRFRRRGIVAAIVAAVTLPFAVAGSIGALATIDNDVFLWTPGDPEEQARFHAMVERFGFENPVFVSWEGCTVDDPRLACFAETLRRRAAVELHDSSGRAAIGEVVTTPEVVREYRESRLGLTDEEIVDRLRGVMLGLDGRTACAIVRIDHQADVRDSRIAALVRDVASESCGVAAEKLRVGGFPIENAEVDEQSVRTLYRSLLPSSIFVILIAWPALRSLRLVLATCLAAFWCETATLALIRAFDLRMTGILIVLPSLVFVVLVSGAVHFINYFHDARRTLDRGAAIVTAASEAWKPCILAMLTTAAGVFSLCTSRIEPVRDFAYLASAGVLLALVALLSFIPAALLLFGPGPSAPRHPAAERHVWERWAAFIARSPSTVMWTAGILVAVGLIGLPRASATMKMDNFLPRRNKVVRDQVWLERTIGPLLPVDVVIGIDRASPITMHDQLALLSRITSAIDSDPHLGGAFSAADLAPAIDSASDFAGLFRHRMVEQRLDRNRSRFVSSGYLFEAPEADLWRITARAYSLSPDTYEQQLDALHHAVRAALDDQPEFAERVTVTITGLLPLIAGSRRQLLHDLAWSYVGAIAAIGLILTLSMRNVSTGLLALVPNVFPAVIVFGLAGWMRLNVDISSLLTATVALGISVDDTVHYLTWYDHERKNGSRVADALMRVHAKCGPAMLRTTLICIAGMLPLLVSDFLPASRFGALCCLLLAVALVSNLVLLPALLSVATRRRNRS